MQPITYSQARAGLADLYDQALEHLPTRIERRRADPAVLLSLEDFRTLLSQFAFSPEVLFEASSVAVWLPELAIWGRGSTFAEAKEDLLAEIDQLLALLAEDARLRSAPNMVERLPWIFRLMDAESDAEREALLFAVPATEARPLAVAGARATPLATFGDLKTFVEHDGWTEEPNLARGRAQTGDHWRSRKDRPDGTSLRTKVSHSLRDEIGIDLFKHILRDQLQVTEDRFWDVVRGGVTEVVEAPPRQAATIPGWLVQRLILTAGLRDADVRAMTVDEAHAAWEACKAQPR